MTNIKQKPEEYPHNDKPATPIDALHQKVNEQLEELRERALKAEKERGLFAGLYSDAASYISDFLDSLVNKTQHSVFGRNGQLYVVRYKFDNTQIGEEIRLPEYLVSVVASIRLGHTHLIHKPIEVPEAQHLPEKVAITTNDNTHEIIALAKRVQQLEVLSEAPVNLMSLDQTDKDLSQRISVLETELRPLLNLARIIDKK